MAAERQGGEGCFNLAQRPGRGPSHATLVSCRTTGQQWPWFEAVERGGGREGRKRKGRKRKGWGGEEGSRSAGRGVGRGAVRGVGPGGPVLCAGCAPRSAGCRAQCLNGAACSRSAGRVSISNRVEQQSNGFNTNAPTPQCNGRRLMRASPQVRCKISQEQCNLRDHAYTISGPFSRTSIASSKCTKLPALAGLGRAVEYYIPCI